MFVSANISKATLYIAAVLRDTVQIARMVKFVILEIVAGRSEDRKLTCG